jgi:hypothetical protein
VKVTTATTRSPRKDVQGTQGWEVNRKGEFFRYRQRRETTGDRAPTIDLGPYYDGRIPPAYGDARERFVDEIVAWEFLGPPPKHIKGMHVLHKDGDGSNCAADNLLWVIDDEYFDALAFYKTERAMQHSSVPPMRKNKLGRYKPTSRARRILFVNSEHVCDYIPISSRKAG